VPICREALVTEGDRMALRRHPDVPMSVRLCSEEDAGRPVDNVRIVAHSYSLISPSRIGAFDARGLGDDP
jgi:hypothetical protein